MESDLESPVSATRSDCFFLSQDFYRCPLDCLRCRIPGKDGAADLPEETGKKRPQQLEQQLIQIEQQLDNLMAQLDPLFECVTTLAGAR
ncbi:hypothetical protein P7K49_017756 [Saguinus oedipus]|uniref:Mediator of RNA polymerase II transcription subunit 30 n=1 Tax=Saguinus oedipus TaxID=9490 RepID=A0ABQ9V441_SAGOE|nr:hypothetical protein P7K49_017756 [Saguinus oedipus]